MQEITNNIYYVGVNDRNKALFEGLWPLPNGVSYNSYLIVDEKVCLVDTVEVDFFVPFIERIREVIGDRQIDYLVINHMEPDHSGSIGLIKKYYPGLKIVGNSKTFDMMKGFYGIADGTHLVKEGDTLSLGSRELRFAMIPMVHWPETMVTFDTSAGALFSGDAFGCFGALNGGLVDSQINYICSTHGPVWHENIDRVVKLYDRMSRYETDPGLVICYGTMYGNTERAAEVVAAAASRAGLKDIVMYNVSKTHHSYIIRDVFRYRGLIVGAPTYNAGLYHEMEVLLSELAGKDIKNHCMGWFGSYAWAGKAVAKIKEWNDTRLHYEAVGTPVEIRQSLDAATHAACEALGRDMARRLLG